MNSKKHRLAWHITLILSTVVTTPVMAKVLTERVSISSSGEQGD